MKLGDRKVKFIYTPGHTLDSMSLLIENILFTGDSLHISGIARTDLPGGKNADMFKTINSKFSLLPDYTVIFPGHDYHGNTTSTIGYEKANNPFMKPKSLQEFAIHVDKAFSPIKSGMSCSANLATSSDELSPMQKAFCHSVINYANSHVEEYSISAKMLLECGFFHWNSSGYKIPK